MCAKRLGAWKKYNKLLQKKTAMGFFHTYLTERKTIYLLHCWCSPGANVVNVFVSAHTKNVSQVIIKSCANALKCVKKHTLDT